MKTNGSKPITFVIIIFMLHVITNQKRTVKKFILRCIILSVIIFVYKTWQRFIMFKNALEVPGTATDLANK